MNKGKTEFVLYGNARKSIISQMASIIMKQSNRSENEWNNSE